jgi:transposase-like protein
MDRCVGAAAKLPENDRKDLAVQALARSATISDLSTRHGVSRKFVYQQANKARHALDDGRGSKSAHLGLHRRPKTAGP